MKKLLQINSGLHGSASHSTQLASEFSEAYLHHNPGSEVTVRDLNASPVPHLDAETFATFHGPQTAVSPKQKDALSLSDTLVGELQEADVLVLGVPMYNLGIPSTLKAWIDHVARARVTFRYTATGVEGLLQNKKACIMMARGGEYAGTPADVQTQYLKLMLGFIGITDIHFIYAEGLAQGPEKQVTALQAATQQMHEALQSKEPAGIPV